MDLKTERVKVLILGTGPAGLTCAIYAARFNLNPIVYEGHRPGGQLTTTSIVENFPGFPDGILGAELIENMKKQSIKYGAEIRYGIATKVDFTGPIHKVWIDDGNLIETPVVVIATGATAKYLGLPSEEKYIGKGVSACATCDGLFYKNKTVAVIGGGDSACEEATYLSNICKKVYMIVRRNEMRASKILQQRVLSNPKIEIIFEHQPKEIIGDNNIVTGLVIIDKNNNEKILNLDGIFVAIGHKPNTEIFKPFLEIDENGYILTKPNSTQTNVPGVFACGDVQDKFYKQAVVAAGSGCMAAIEAEKYLQTLKLENF